MRVWRFTKAEWLASAFSGEGARQHGGRWNHPGAPMVYTASSVALGCLELLVHSPRGAVPADYFVIPATIPSGAKVERIREASLPSSWRQTPAHVYLQDIGTKWMNSRRTAILSVPSAVCPYDNNYLLNPEHPDFGAIRIGPAQPFDFDPRMFTA